MIVKDGGIATTRFDENNLYVTGVGVGQTEIKVVTPNSQQTAIVTVREGASDNGWL